MSEDVETPGGSESAERRNFPRIFFKEKPVKVGDELEVTISELSRRGDGLTRIEGYVIFVPNTKQGDKVKIKITQIRPNFALAEVVSQPTLP
jgi:predicted RNA-binding protein with TRAM domain